MQSLSLAPPAFREQVQQSSEDLSSEPEELSSEPEDRMELSPEESSSPSREESESLEEDYARNLQQFTDGVKKSEPIDDALLEDNYRWISADDLSKLDGEGLTLADYAALNGHKNVLQAIQSDDTVSEDARSRLFSEALCRCSVRGLLEMCQFLLTLGAAANHRSNSENGLTPLEYAIQKNQSPLFEFFVSYPSIDLGHGNVYALHFARRRPTMTRALLQNGANPYPTAPGRTPVSPVHYAIQEALRTGNWSLLEPYVESPLLKFDDYLSAQDILNPLIEKHLAAPQDMRLRSLLEALFKHQNFAAKGDYFLLKALKQRVVFADGVFQLRLQKACEQLSDAKKAPTLRRTVLYLLFERGETQLAMGLQKKFGIKLALRKFLQIAEIGLEIKESVLELLCRTSQDDAIRGYEQVISTLSEEGEAVAAVHYAKGVIAFSKGKDKPQLYATALSHFQRSCQTYNKSFKYMGEILTAEQSPVKDPLLGEGCSVAYSCNQWLYEFDETEMAAKVVTKLLYRAKRHSWADDTLCGLMRHLAVALDRQLGEMDQAGYASWLRKHETETHDYYGEELSDDSDAEEETQFSKQSHFFSGTIEHHFERLINKAEGERFEQWLNDFEANAQTIKLEKIREFFHQKERAPERRMADQQIERDLQTLNLFAARGELAEGIASITTKFFIAQYRGISYETTQWNAERRRAHRSLDETDLPYFSAACYDMAEEGFHQSSSERNGAALEASAKALKVALLKFREEPPVEKPRPRKIAYGSRAIQLQELYSRSKKGFMKELPTLNLGSLLNPFVSTGDTPFHALKYAYGIKPYEENKEDRLRPRWRKDGQAERPYSGKVYLFLNPIDDYSEEGPLHVPSLHFSGAISVASIILNERESTFPAYIPPERVKYAYKAKYPSFKGEYKSIYLYKYGLKKVTYDKLKSLFEKYPPHSKERKAVKAMLGEYLCAYHEVRLQDKAQEIIHKLGQNSGQSTALIYRTELGGFSLTRPVYVYPNNPTKNPVHKVDAQSIKRRLDRRLSDNPQPRKRPHTEADIE